MTTWENEFRQAAGQQTYNGDFIATWLHDALFFEAQPWVSTVAYTAFGLLVVIMMLFVPPGKRIQDRSTE